MNKRKPQIAPRDEVHCINAHDRCYGGAGTPCPYCEPEWPPRDAKGRFARVRIEIDKETSGGI
jgi:hypothetical protein